MIDNATYRNLKSRLTRAKNSGDPQKVMAEVEHAVAVFNDKGWPDAWPTWRCAAWDAVGPFNPKVDALFNF